MVEGASLTDIPAPEVTIPIMSAPQSGEESGQFEMGGSSVDGVQVVGAGNGSGSLADGPVMDGQGLVVAAGDWACHN